MTDTLIVGLYSWIIQDGNYAEFSRDAEVAFALEMHAPSPLKAVDPDFQPVPSLRHVGGAHYEAVGQAVYVADDWWVFDIGVLTFREERPPVDLCQGNWLRGEIFIGIDPFYYFERLAHQAGAPALIYDWKIEKIEEQTSPLIEVRPRVMARDPNRLGWKEIAETNSREDAGEYLLHCKRIGGPRLPAGKRHP
jgi:hypothetical protein